MPKRKHSHPSKTSNDSSTSTSDNQSSSNRSKRSKSTENPLNNKATASQSCSSSSSSSSQHALDYTPYVYVNIYVYRDGVPRIKESKEVKGRGRNKRHQKHVESESENEEEKLNPNVNENDGIMNADVSSSATATSKPVAHKADTPADVPIYVSIRPSHINSVTHRYQPLLPFNVYMSPLCAAPRLRISTSNRIVYGEKGYRSIRATHGIVEGSWYWEARIIQPKASIQRDLLNSLPHQVDYTEPHVRVGWSNEKGDLHAPVGYDRHGYCYIDHNGYKYHESYPSPYGQSFGVGDFIGCHIYLPSLYEYLLKEKNFDLHGYENAQQNGNAGMDGMDLSSSSYSTTISSLYGRRPPKRKKGKKKVKKDGDGDHEDDKPSITSLSAGEIELYRQRSETYVLGSKITFYKNGISQGVAFTDVLRSTYMPTISLYMSAAVEVNFGPNYTSPPMELYHSSGSSVRSSGLYPQFIDSLSTMKRNPEIPIDKIGIQPVDDGKKGKKKKDVLD